MIKASPSARVIILSMHHTAGHVFRALKAGARVYLLKESAGAEVVKAVRAVMQGKSYFSRGGGNPSGGPSRKRPARPEESPRQPEYS